MSFEHAPVTKGLMILLAILSLVASVFNVKHYFHLQLVPHISRYHQYWRLFTHHLVFSNSSDLFLSELLLYNLSIPVERQFGSTKFASFVTVSLLISTVFEFLALLFLQKVSFNLIPSGPFTLVFSILFQHLRIVPSNYDLRVFGVCLNNHSFIYAPALQMACSHYLSTLITAVIGLLTGKLYRSEMAGLHTYRLPGVIRQFSLDYLLPLIGSTRPPRRTTQGYPDDPPPPTEDFSSTIRSIGRAARLATNGETITTARRQAETPREGTSVMREWVDELTGRGQATAAGLRVVSEAEVAQVTSMFPDMEHSVIVAALQRSTNVESAVATLLSSQA